VLRRPEGAADGRGSWLIERLPRSRRGTLVGGARMLIKVLTLLLLGIVATRVLLQARWKGLGLWLKRCVDLAFLVIVVIYAVQLLVIALR
jgi:hypothetical protein